MQSEHQSVDRYVTNSDRRVYCLRGLPPEVRAVLFAYVSRSPLSFRENLKKLLREGELDLAAEDPGPRFDSARASRFHEKWVLEYGHASVAEHANLHFAVEDVSMLAAKILEDNRLASFTEKSSRYQVFDLHRFHWPAELEPGPLREEAHALVGDLFRAYGELYEPVRELLAAKTERPTGLGERAWRGTLHAAVCDVIRYILPAGTLTSLGITANARSAAHMIRKLRAHPLAEMRGLGDELEREGTAICPVLLKHARPGSYALERGERLKAVLRELDLPPQDEQARHTAPRVRLVDHDPEGGEAVCADLLYASGKRSREEAGHLARGMGLQRRRRLLAAALDRMGPHDWPPRALEQVMVTVEFCVDFGAFRDLQRHRMATQSVPPLDCAWSYETPPALERLPAGGRFHELMQRAAETWHRISGHNAQAASYFVPLAYRIPFTLRMNLRECEHLVRLRSARSGHPSYRLAAVELQRLLGEAYPELIDWFRVDREETPWARAGEEERNQDRAPAGA